MQIIKTIQEMVQVTQSVKMKNKMISFVPTMGYLHAAHLALFTQAKEEADCAVASIFVNPMQFNDAEDYHKYPIDTNGDISKAENAGIDILFMPSVEEVYPGKKPGICIQYPDMADKLCARFRPNHFEGVLLVVHNLFQWIQPNSAVFGLKDYQQYLLIRRMAADLHLNVKVIGAPIMREKDGLAYSSRNARLSPEGRKKALRISNALFKTRSSILEGHGITAGQAHETLMSLLEDLPAEYAGIYNVLTLEEIPRTISPEQGVIAIAAYVDGVRLIDNVLI